MKKQHLHRLIFALFCLPAVFILAGCPTTGDSNASDDPSNSGDQWHLENTGQKAYASGPSSSGQDINQDSSYSFGISGNGVIVAIVDSGLEIAHTDLDDNVVAEQNWDFVGNDIDPTYSGTDGDHGTSVGGIVAAEENSNCCRGVAPKASLKGFNFIESTQTTSEQIAALGGSSQYPHSDDVDIFNMSYGRSNNYDLLIDSTLEAHLASSVNTLRDGKGAIFVKSAGNGFEDFGSASCTAANSEGLSCQNVSNDPPAATPYIINVGALNAEGKRSSYSTAGSGVWISAPGGEYGYNESLNPNLVEKAYKPAIMTTDQSGCDTGYARTQASPRNAFQDNSNGANPNCDFTSTFNGTSSAAPVTSGSIALMLEANPSLTWRDVKHILASTARKVDPTESGVSVGLSNGNYQADLGWFTNGAGYHFHNWYGFGAVNVDAAVEMAFSYSSGWGDLTTATGSKNAGSVAIPDNDKDGVTSEIVISESLTIESVTIAVTITHGYCGDLGIELVSPAGTKSILFNIKNGFNSADLNGMVLLSNAYYAENSAGTWTIRVLDGWSTTTGTFDSWDLTIYGH